MEPTKYYYQSNHFFYGGHVTIRNTVMPGSDAAETRYLRTGNMKGCARVTDTVLADGTVLDWHDDTPHEVCRDTSFTYKKVDNQWVPLGINITAAIAAGVPESATPEECQSWAKIQIESDLFIERAKEIAEAILAGGEPYALGHGYVLIKGVLFGESWLFKTFGGSAYGEPVHPRDAPKLIALAIAESQ